MSLMHKTFTTLSPVLAIPAVALPSSAIASGPAAAVGTGGGVTSAVPAAGPDTLAERIDARLREAGLEEYGVAYRDLGSGREILLNPDAEFHAASTMKVPIRELVRPMIARSSNLATHELIRLADAGATRAMLEEIGAGGLRVLRGVEDIPAYRHGMNNTTTARALMELLSALARGDLAGPEATRQMMSILEAQHFNDGIPAGLPDTVNVAHKTGWITGIVHDAAVVDPPGAAPYVLVVLTRGDVEAERARRAVADVSRMIWDAR